MSRRVHGSELWLNSCVCDYLKPGLALGLSCILYFDWQTYYKYINLIQWESEWKFCIQFRSDANTAEAMQINTMRASGQIKYFSKKYTCIRTYIARAITRAVSARSRVAVGSRHRRAAAETWLYIYHWAWHRHNRALSMHVHMHAHAPVPVRTYRYTHPVPVLVHVYVHAADCIHAPAHACAYAHIYRSAPARQRDRSIARNINLQYAYVY